MTWLSWAVLYEGDSDASYFDVLLPRLMTEIVFTRGTRHSDVPLFPSVRIRRDEVEVAAREICEAREAFHLIFVHTDSGGRAVAASLDRLRSGNPSAHRGGGDPSTGACPR